MKYAVDVASSGMIHISRLIMIGSDIQVMLRLLPQQPERLQCWYHRQEGFMKSHSDGFIWHDTHTKFPEELVLQFM
jgi:hypothetical protein